MRNKLSNIEIKKDCINFVLSISLAIISYIFLAKVISQFYNPDTSLIIIKSMMILIPSLISSCLPEPLERNLFIAGIVLIPVFLFVYYSFFNKLLKNKDANLINNIWIFICIYILTILPLFIFMVLNAASVYLPPYSYLQLYILNSVLDKNVSLFVYVPFIIISYILLKINFSPENKPFKIITILLDIFCLLLIAYMATLYVFSIYTTSANFESVFYSIVQLFKGTPLGVDGFTNTYGLYPYFLNIIFKITGLSVLKCSIVFCILIALSFLLIFFFLKNTVENKFLIFLGFTSVVFLPNLSGQLFLVHLFGRVEPYYAYLPIRYLSPCLLLFVSSLYIKSKNRNFYIISSIICSLSLLWNFDTGIITTISWMLFNFYSEFEQHNIRNISRNILWHILKISAIMIITILFFYLCVFIFYGRVLNLGILIQTLNVFSELGFNMLPMPLIHPWNILALTYITGMGISIRAIIEKNITPWTENVFLVTIMGTGMLLYYQGRSHDGSFWGPSFYFFILLTLFLDKIFYFLRDNRNILLQFISILLASILSLSVILIFINNGKEISILKDSIKNVQSDSELKKAVEMNCDFIRRHADPSEKIIIFSRNSGIYFSKIPNISAFNPGLIDLFLQSDYERLEKVIADSDIKIFADNSEELNRVAGIFRNLVIIDHNDYMMFIKKK